MSYALDASIVGQEHYDVAREVRRAIRCARDVEHAATHGAEVCGEDRVIAEQGRRLQSFLTQDLYIGEPYTGRPGQFVPVRGTIAACRALLAG